MKKKLKIKIKS